LSEVTIIELIVYALIGYPAIIFLVGSSFQESSGAAGKISVVKAIWIIVPIIAMYMLASAGAVITISDEISITTIGYNTTVPNEVITNSTETTPQKQITLVNPVWITLHWLLFTVLVLYFMWNMLRLFTQRE
jgi:hypothetical protein